MQERAHLYDQLANNRVIIRQSQDADLALALISHCPQVIGLLSLTQVLRIDQEQEAARDIHRFDDQSHGYIRQPLHVENVTDLLTVGMQGLAGVVFLDLQPAVNPALDDG